MNNKSRTAIVYDWIDKWGGVERLILTLGEIFPRAVYFTSFYNPDKAKWADKLEIKTSFLQKFPIILKKSRILSLPFFPYAFESWDFSDFDLVVSVTSSFAKAVLTKPPTQHVCYLLTPTRWLWSQAEDYVGNKPVKALLSPVFNRMRQWDYLAAQRPDKIISISKSVAQRCQRYYRRKSPVIYPAFDNLYWKKIKLKVNNYKQNTLINKQKYFLLVSRLEPYKKVELAIDLFNKLKHNLTIVGEGTRLNSLKKLANNNISFLAGLTDLELGKLYTNAEALIMPQEEDFGYVSLEAQFFGCPVIAYDKGGAAETVIGGKTGIFFSHQSVQSLKKSLSKFDMVKYGLKQSTVEFGEANAEKFAKMKFIRQFKKSL